MKKLLAAGLSVALLAAPVWADTFAGENPRAVPVAYQDLDLRQSQDAATMLSRLRTATARACEMRELAQPGPTARRAIRACRDDALETAIRELNEPEVTRQHQALR